MSCSARRSPTENDRLHELGVGALDALSAAAASSATSAATRLHRRRGRRRGAPTSAAIAGRRIQTNKETSGRRIVGAIRRAGATRRVAISGGDVESRWSSGSLRRTRTGTMATTIAVAAAAEAAEPLTPQSLLKWWLRTPGNRMHRQEHGKFMTRVNEETEQRRSARSPASARVATADRRLWKGGCLDHRHDEQHADEQQQRSQQHETEEVHHVCIVDRSGVPGGKWELRRR